MKAFRLLLLCIVISTYTFSQGDGLFKRVIADTVKAKDYRFQSLPNYSFLKLFGKITSSDSTLTPPPGTTAQRPTVPAGKYILRYNTDSSALEIGNPSQQWRLVGQSADSTNVFNGLTEYSPNLIGLGGKLTTPVYMTASNNGALSWIMDSMNFVGIYTQGYEFSMPPTGSNLAIGSRTPNGARFFLSNSTNYIQLLNNATFLTVSPSFIELRVADSLRFTGAGVKTVTDTTAWKGVVMDARGNIARFNRWEGGGGAGSVTAVGLTMPPAFNVIGSPVTGADTLEVVAIGNIAQYIRGDGSLATFDTTAIPAFHIRVRSLISATSPLLYSAAGVLSIQVATTGQNGYLSQSDFTTFSNKLGDPGGNGIVVRTALGATQNRTLTTPNTNNITLLNPSGAAGNPSIDIGPDVATLTGTQAFTGNKTFATKVYYSSTPTFTAGPDDNALVTLGYLNSRPPDTVKVRGPNLEVFFASGIGQHDTVAVNDTVAVDVVKMFKVATASNSDSALTLDRTTGLPKMAKINGSGGGITIVGTFSGSSQTNGAAISPASTITFGPADATNPGMVSTTGQTFLGLKTFNSGLEVVSTKLIMRGSSSTQLEFQDYSTTRPMDIYYGGGDLIFNAQQSDFGYRDIIRLSMDAPQNALILNSAGNLGIGGITSPSARLHLPAGTATAGSAPLKLTTGTALTTPADGALEYHSSHLFFTIGSTRYQLDQQSGGGSPGGSTTQVQFNDGGTFGGDAGFIYNKTSDLATIGKLALGNYGTPATNDLLYIGRNSAGVYDPMGRFVQHQSDSYTMFSLENDASLGQAFSFGVGGPTETAFGLANQFFIFHLTSNLPKWTLNTDGAMSTGGVVTHAAWLQAPASTTDYAGLLLGPGATPTSLSNGMIWINSTSNHMFARINGTSYQLDQQTSGAHWSPTTASGTGNYTISGNNYITLADLTGQANRTVTLPSSPNTGDDLIVRNENTNASGFTWTFSGGTVRKYDNSTVTTLTNQTPYFLIWNGTSWDINN